MDTRIGYPNEHLAGNSDSETTSPLYATAVGLVLNSLEQKERTVATGSSESAEEPDSDSTGPLSVSDPGFEEPKPIESKRFFDKWAEKFKEFLDNAE